MLSCSFLSGFGPQGFIDLCIRGSELNEITDSPLLLGTGLTRPIRLKRYRPDGLVFERTLRGSNNSYQPFFVKGAIPVDCLIPISDVRIHPNRALEISEMRTEEPIDLTTLNARIKHERPLQRELLSVTIVKELKVFDRIRGPDFSNADRLLLFRPSK